jgi:uncharacterized protein YjiS (DUF1127 family)
MEHPMASNPLTYQADSEAPAPHGSAAPSARELVAFARPVSAWLGAVAVRCAQAIAKEVRVRRDTRALMAMSDEMLKDIGLTRAEISGAVRYGRKLTS